MANVYATGSFTIPLMKRVGYPAQKAGAIEVAAGVDGQIMPPVMGAAAFLMAEYVGVPYTQIIKNAFLPAIISYIALFYIVHLEACKAGIAGIPRGKDFSRLGRLLGILMTFAGIVVLANVVYFGLGWLKPLLGAGALWVILVLLAVVYVLVLRVVAAESRRASPFAAPLLFSYVANFIYAGDAPPAERGAQGPSADQARPRGGAGAAAPARRASGAGRGHGRPRTRARRGGPAPAGLSDSRHPPGPVRGRPNRTIPSSRGSPAAGTASSRRPSPASRARPRR